MQQPKKIIQKETINQSCIYCYALCMHKCIVYCVWNIVSPSKIFWVRSMRATFSKKNPVLPVGIQHIFTWIDCGPNFLSWFFFCFILLLQISPNDTTTAISKIHHSASAFYLQNTCRKIAQKELVFAAFLCSYESWSMVVFALHRSSGNLKCTAVDCIGALHRAKKNYQWNKHFQRKYRARTLNLSRFIA